MGVDLAPELRPIASLCGRLATGPIGARAGDADAIRIVHAHLTPVGDEAATVFVDRYETSLGAGALASPSSTCTTTFRPGVAGLDITLARGLGLSPSGALAHFGIQARGRTPDGWHFEARAYVVGPDCVFRERELSTFGGTLMLSEDPDAVLLLGVTEGGTGLWRGDDRIVDSSASGSVQRFGAEHVLLPTTTGHGAYLLELFRAADLRDGTAPIGSVARSDFGAWPGVFVVLEGRGIAGLPSGRDDDHWLHAIEVVDGRIPDREPTFLASSRIAQVVPIDGTERALLQHDTGVLVVE
jgi:hypothetical protein